MHKLGMLAGKVLKSIWPDIFKFTNWFYNGYFNTLIHLIDVYKSISIFLFKGNFLIALKNYKFTFLSKVDLYNRFHLINF